ncbi:unnamed protein product [Prunus armeniaca]|uniref:Uncharacterized protein n=1 Tax=Prunus armeniaca TaxID=36596 RepID=A0A6J5XY96_PRUAR|nr:unnamed protein product [Prunus armeniaca]CAB4316725.1 unnamed protein product [Prunus armeniaca]
MIHLHHHAGKIVMKLCHLSNLICHCINLNIIICYVCREHKNILIQSSVDNVEESYRLQFSNWISKRVTELYNDGKVSKQMLSLARGPKRRRDENKKTQNSGVMVKEENQIDDVPWYGILVDIVELRYT